MMFPLSADRYPQDSVWHMKLGAGRVKCVCSPLIQKLLSAPQCDSVRLLKEVWTCPSLRSSWGNSQESQVSNYFLGMREQKRFDSDLKVVTEECVHCFISTRTVTPVYSNLALHPCSLVANFKESFEKQPPPSQRVTLQESPAHDATLLWMSSQALLNFLTRRPDQSAWRRAVSEIGPEVKPRLGLPEFCLVPVSLQNMHGLSSPRLRIAELWWVCDCCPHRQYRVYNVSSIINVWREYIIKGALKCRKRH